MLRSLLRGRWFGRRDPLPSLGRLEAEVMEVVWQGRDLPVREVQGKLPRSVAYTTVMTTLDRLYKKGLVGRRQVGRAFVYSALFTREQLAADLTTGLLTHVLARGSEGAEPFLSNLVDAVAAQDAELLDKLERLVRNRRHRERRGRK